MLCRQLYDFRLTNQFCRFPGNLDVENATLGFDSRKAGGTRREDEVGVGIVSSKAYE